MDKHNHPYDVVVIGAGVSGLGAAMAAARRGLKTIIVEKSKIGAGTSANSLRIMHGGFRYLQSLNVVRTWKSSRDQSWLISEMPHLIKPLPCIMPLSRFGVRSALPLQGASALFKLLSPHSYPLPYPKTMQVSELRPSCSLITPVAPHGVLCWHDAILTSHEDLVSDLCARLSSQGVELRENCAVTCVKERGDIVHIEASRLNEKVQIQAHAVVTAVGPWFGGAFLGDAVHKHKAEFAPAWCVGFNVVFKRLYEPTYAIGIRASDDRLFFLVPRKEGVEHVSVLGTDYYPYEGDPHSVRVPEQRVDEFLACFRRVLPHAGISPDDVHRIEAGVLPMRNAADGKVALYGNARLLRRGRIVEILSTKYTTFRSQGEEALKALLG